MDIHASLVYVRLFLSAQAIGESVVKLISTSYVPGLNLKFLKISFPKQLKLYLKRFLGINCTDSEMFHCNDNTCIARELQCNRRPNCPLEEDEKDCFIESPGIQFSTGPYLAILIIIGALILVIAICALIINVCPPKPYKDRKRKNLMTQSRGAQGRGTGINSFLI